MTVCGKHGKTIKPFSHPSHKPWKSLRNSHIPSVLRLIIFTQFSNQKRSLPQLPNPRLFRLIFQLEKTEQKRISLITIEARSVFIIAQGHVLHANEGLLKPNDCQVEQSQKKKVFSI